MEYIKDENYNQRMKSQRKWIADYFYQEGEKLKCKVTVCMKELSLKKTSDTALKYRAQERDHQSRRSCKRSTDHGALRYSQ